MKSIALKVSSLVLIYVVSFPGLACAPSDSIIGKSVDPESLSNQMQQRVIDQFDKPSF